MPGGRKTLAKLEITGGDDLYILTTLIGEDGEEGFDLVISDGVKGWTASLDENDLETLSHDVKMDYTDYVTQTRKALTRVNLGALNFVYQTKKQKNGSLLLNWKKHMLAENIKFQLGSVKLNEADDDSSITEMIFNQAIEATADLQSSISTLQAENERMATERANALKRLEKCVSAKEELENDLYAKFAIVVNDKKAKIRELKGEVDDLRNGVSSSALAGPSTSNSHSKSRGDNRDTDDEDIGVASDYDTDEEAPRPKKKSKPSAKVKTEPDSLDDSLMLDTGDDVLPTKGRRRRREVTKKSSPAKAVLPKVSSTPKAVTPSTSRAGRRTSMRKSGSNTSNVSSDQVDADDMIDDMF